MTPTDFNFLIWLADQGLSGWHLAMAAGAVILYWLIRSRTKFKASVEVGGNGNGNATPPRGQVDMQHFLNFRQAVREDFKALREDIKDLREEMIRRDDKHEEVTAGIRVKVQEVREKVAAIEAGMRK